MISCLRLIFVSILPIQEEDIKMKPIAQEV